MTRAPRATVVVAGYIVRYPLAGSLLASLQYVLGFERLGCRAYFLEESGNWPNSCFDPTTCRSGDDATSGLAALDAAMRAHGLGDRWVYVDRERRHHGLDAAATASLLAAADCLVNVSGVNWLPEFRACRRRVFIDTDPGFTQFRLARSGAEPGGWGDVRAHDLHFTYGANIGRPECPVPTGGLAWRPTHPPVVLDLWPVVGAAPDRPYTTVMNWQAYDNVEYGGVLYGQKDREFERFIDLPRRAPVSLAVAVAGAAAPRERLAAHGWQVRDGVAASTTIADYTDFIAASRGEFTVAKHGYVAARTGWFGDRSAAYLASGKPVVMQDTGFAAALGARDGLVAVSTVDEAVAAFARIEGDYAAHSGAARALAERWFASDVVLAEILEAAGL